MPASGLLVCSVCGSTGGGDDPCRCGCPCGTAGGITSCDGRIAHPLDASITLTNATATTEVYTGPARVYSNLTDIAAYIAETDPAAANDNYEGLIVKIQSVWSMTGTTYDLSDNTSIGCVTSHVGYWCHYEALNGDTYTFDAMGGLPRITNSVSVLSTTRRSGNDFIGTATDGDSIENNSLVDFTLRPEDAMVGECRTTVTVNSYGATSFITTFLPVATKIPNANGSGGFNGATIRAKYTNARYNYTEDSGTIIDRYYNFGTSATWIPIDVNSSTHVFGNTGAATKLVDQIGTEGDLDVRVCEGDVELEQEDSVTSAYPFDIDARSTAPGAFIVAPLSFYFTDADYTAGGSSFAANFVTKIESTATVGARSNPGGETCSRCYTIEFTETDGDTSAVTTLWSGEIVQSVSSRIAFDEDPEQRETWPTQTVWYSRGDSYPRFTIGRFGKTLWEASITAYAGAAPMVYQMIGGDCPNSITDVVSRVEELFVNVTPTGAGTVASPLLRQNTTRLKIDTRSFTATPATCTDCLEDPCEEPCEPATIQVYNTAEQSSGGYDIGWAMETSNGSGVFGSTPALLTGYSGVYADPPSADCSWIGIDAVATGFGGSRSFRTSAICTGTQAQLDAMTLNGVFGVDDSVATITVNGVVVASGVGGTFTSFTSFSIPGTALHPGANTIDFEVSNPATGDAAGLLVKFTNDTTP